MSSNVFYIPAAVRAFQLGAYSEGVVLSIITAVSTMWHTCLGYDFCWGFPQSFLQHFDVFVSLSVFVLIAVYILAFSKHEAKAIAYILGYIFVYAIQLLGGSVHAIFILVGILAAALIGRLFYYKTYPYQDLDILDLVASAIFGAVGVVFYVWFNDSGVVHGFWHLMTGLSAFFAIESLSHKRTLIFWTRNSQTPDATMPSNSQPSVDAPMYITLADVVS